MRFGFPNAAAYILKVLEPKTSVNDYRNLLLENYHAANDLVSAGKDVSGYTAKVRDCIFEVMQEWSTKQYAKPPVNQNAQPRVVLPLSGKQGLYFDECASSVTSSSSFFTVPRVIFAGVAFAASVYGVSRFRK